MKLQYFQLWKQPLCGLSRVVCGAHNIFKYILLSLWGPQIKFHAPPFLSGWRQKRQKQPNAVYMVKYLKREKWHTVFIIWGNKWLKYIWSSDIFRIKWMLCNTTLRHIPCTLCSYEFHQLYLFTCCVIYKRGTVVVLSAHHVAGLWRRCCGDNSSWFGYHGDLAADFERLPQLLTGGHDHVVALWGHSHSADFTWTGGNHSDVVRWAY